VTTLDRVLLVARERLGGCTPATIVWEVAADSLARMDFAWDLEAEFGGDRRVSAAVKDLPPATPLWEVAGVICALGEGRA
jgi:hypothetical protein